MSIFSPTTVTLNLFQGPSISSISDRAARWMLNQVQHDGAEALLAFASRWNMIALRVSLAQQKHNGN